LAVLSISIFALNKHNRAEANSDILDTEEAKQIQEVIAKSYEIEAIAANTFDTSLFSSVFVNDPRGGSLSESTNEFIKSVTTNNASENLGYLDYKLAYYNWWKQGALKFEQLQTKATQEGRSITKDELKTLIDEHGRLAIPRSQISSQDQTLKFLSLSINGEIASVIFDDGPRTNKMIVVKIKDKWYIAGNMILSVHP